MNEFISVYGFFDNTRCSSSSLPIFHILIYLPSPGIPRRKGRSNLQGAHPDHPVNLWSTHLKRFITGTLVIIHKRARVWHSETYIPFVRARTEQSEAQGRVQGHLSRPRGSLLSPHRVDSTCHREEVPKLHQAQHRTSSQCTRSQGCWVSAHCTKKPPWPCSSTPPTAAQLSAPSRAELRLHLGLRPPRTEEVSKG